MNAIELLKDDHRTVRALLSELESSTTRAPARRTQLLEEIERELTIHARIEEEIFYPAFKEAGEKRDDDKLYFEALEEHRAVEDLVLPDLKHTDPASDRFGGRAKVLKELIEHHAREEEKEMFPRARKLLGAARLRELGEAMEAMKAELLPGPAPKPKSLVTSVLTAFGAVPPPSPAKATSKQATARKSAPRKASAKKSPPPARKRSVSTGQSARR